MAVQSPLYVIQNASHPAKTFRQANGYYVNTEGVGTTGDLAVTANSTPAMNVDVAAGEVWIKGDSATDQGFYFGYNDATVNLAIASADGSNPRIDIVVAQVNDAAYSGSANNSELKVITGTAAASPSAPSLPSSAYKLATIAVGAGVTTIVSGNITDNRTTVEVATYGVHHFEQTTAPGTTTNKLYNVGGALYWNGADISTAGDITGVTAGTNLNGGGASGDVTLNLDTTLTGGLTFSGGSTFEADKDITSFASDTEAGVQILNSQRDIDDFTCLDFGYTDFKNIGRIGLKIGSGGSELHFGTSNSYASGITNTAMIISQDGLLGIGASPLTTRGMFVQREGTVFEFHQNTDVASGAVYCGMMRIGTDGTAPGTGDYWILFRKGDNTTIGSIRGTAGNSVNFQTTSDQTMKNDLGDAGDCGAILDKIKIHKYTWKDAPEQGDQIGLFAQETLSEVSELPDGIVTPSTTMKEENEAGEEVESYLPAGADYSKLVPLLIQEVKSLRQRVATLEG